MTRDPLTRARYHFDVRRQQPAGRRVSGPVRTRAGGGFIRTTVKGRLSADIRQTRARNEASSPRRVGEAFLFMGQDEATVSTPATPRICVTVGGATTAELRRARDQVRDADSRRAAARLGARSRSRRQRSPGGGCPVIITCRPRWEGGHFDRLGGRTPAAAAPRVGTRRRVRRRRARGAVRPPVPHEHARAPRRPLAARLQPACRAISADASRPCAIRRPRSSRSRCSAARLSDALEVFGLQRLLRGRAFVAIGMGAAGRRHPRARLARGLVLDLRG